jgi:hypothetical protein
MEPLSQATGEIMVEKTWQIPAKGDKAGPVTVVVRVPNVLIIDSRQAHPRGTRKSRVGERQDGRGR